MIIKDFIISAGFSPGHTTYIYNIYFDGKVSVKTSTNHMVFINDTHIDFNKKDFYIFDTTGAACMKLCLPEKLTPEQINMNLMLGVYDDSTNN